MAKKIADAVLYEGYMLYPYRPSAIKNRQRWTFGILYPPSYIEVPNGTERSTMHSECLLQVTGGPTLRPTVQIQLRFLHLLARQVEKSLDDQNVPSASFTGRFQSVPSLIADGRLVESWDESVERSVEIEFELASLLNSQHRFDFHFPGSNETQLLSDNSGHLLGRILRTQNQVTGTVSVSSEKIGNRLLKLTIEVANTTPSKQDPSDRNAALLNSLLSAHTILTANGAKWISLLDPIDASANNADNDATQNDHAERDLAENPEEEPPRNDPPEIDPPDHGVPDHDVPDNAPPINDPPVNLSDAASACRNVGNFPVLVGSPTERDLLLCSPIVLYDYPRIAPESANDFYDATEMDEMLTLRVMTLTGDEKNEMRHADDRVRDLLQRTEQSAREQLMRTHGTIRGMRPVSEKP
jgi:hypothetical protein